jgi:acetyl esterase/lipase
VTTLGLVVVIFWGLQTAPTITRALDEGLGKQWRTAIDPTIAARVLSRFAALALLGPFAIRRWNVEHVTNISYGEAGKYHPLDLYHQRSRLTNAPVLTHFHGGAFVGGKKSRWPSATLPFGQPRLGVYQRELPHRPRCDAH